MKINTKIRYGLRTMLEFANPDNKAGMLQKDIAKNQELSEKYLDPIISALKTAGLIVNVGGKKSGYILAKPSNKITVYDVFRAFEMGPCIVPCVLSPKACERASECASIGYWTELNDTIAKHMKSVTIEKLSKEEELLRKKKIKALKNKK
jgi:Rrf2 family protein